MKRRRDGQNILRYTIGRVDVLRDSLLRRNRQYLARENRRVWFDTSHKILNRNLGEGSKGEFCRRLVDFFKKAVLKLFLLLVTDNMRLDCDQL